MTEKIKLSSAYEDYVSREAKRQAKNDMFYVLVTVAKVLPIVALGYVVAVLWLTW